MITHELTLGGREATIFQPEPGYDNLDVFRAVFPSNQIYGLDVESTYLTDRKHWDPTFVVRLVQVATEGYAWVLNPDDQAHLDLLNDIFQDTTVGFCSHTNMDVLAAHTLGFDIVDRNIDTRLLARMAAEDDHQGGKDLKELVRQHIGPEMAEGEAALYARFAELWKATDHGRGTKAQIHEYGWANIDISEKVYAAYAGLDAVACRRLLDILIPATGAPASLLDSELWLAAQATRIQIRGMRVDETELRQMNAEATAAIAFPEARIVELTSGVLPRSPKLAVWLAEQGVDLSPLPLTKGGKSGEGTPSLAKTGPAILLEQDPPEPAREVLTELTKFRSYIDRQVKTTGILNHLVDGRVHPVLHTVGAVTGRMSSAGPNFQNFSKTDPAMRGLFIPEPGNVFLTADFDQIELRVVAALADETKMIDVILSGGDLHQLTADEVGVPRQLAKMVNFLIVYGGGARALADQAGINRDYAGDVVSTFRQRYSAINDLSRRLALETEFVRTISGRRVPVPPDRSYANINYVVQGSARDILVDAWRRFADTYGRASYVWYPIHDELVLECPESEVATVAAEIESCMSFDFLGVPITASAVVLRDKQGVSRWMPSSLSTP